MMWQGAPASRAPYLGGACRAAQQKQPERVCHCWEPICRAHGRQHCCNRECCRGLVAGMGRFMCGAHHVLQHGLDSCTCSVLMRLLWCSPGVLQACAPGRHKQDVITQRSEFDSSRTDATLPAGKLSSSNQICNQQQCIVTTAMSISSLQNR